MDWTRADRQAVIAAVEALALGQTLELCRGLTEADALRAYLTYARREMDAAQASLERWRVITALTVQKLGEGVGPGGGGSAGRIGVWSIGS